MQKDYSSKRLPFGPAIGRYHCCQGRNGQFTYKPGFVLQTVIHLDPPLRRGSRDLPLCRREGSP